jgi:Flp pilus assembly protein TadD
MMRENNWVEALAELQAARRSNPRSPGIVMNIAFAHVRLGSRSEALVAARQAHELALREERVSPGESSVLRSARLVAMLAAAEGNPEEGVTRLTALKGVVPDRGPLAEALAHALSRAGRLDQALAELDQVLATDPNNRPVLVSRCLIQVYGGRMDGANSDCAAALRLDPSYAPALEAIALVQMHGGDFAAADATLSQLIERRGAGSTFFLRGLARRQLGQGEASEADLTTARDMNPLAEVQGLQARCGLRIDGPVPCPASFVTTSTPP